MIPQSPKLLVSSPETASVPAPVHGPARPVHPADPHDRLACTCMRPNPNQRSPALRVRVTLLYGRVRLVSQYVSASRCMYLQINVSLSVAPLLPPPSPPRLVPQ